MYDGTFNAGNLARLLRTEDFLRDPLLFSVAHRNQIVGEAVRLGRVGVGNVPAVVQRGKGKPLFQLASLPHSLVERHLSTNVRRLTGSIQTDRYFIVSCLATLLREGLPFRIYKFDVKSFYESIDAGAICSSLANDIAFSEESTRALMSIFAGLPAPYVKGLPRGLALSATLSEYHMRDFDRGVGNLDGVWFYARFVDDVIVVADIARVPSLLLSDIKVLLPEELDFNEKSQVLTFTPAKKGKQGVEGVFSYLGYQFTVSHAVRASDNLIARTVDIDLAPRKIRKYKTRVATALRQFQSDGNYADLRDRIRYLTSNFSYVDRKTDTKRFSGLRFNYPLVTSADSPGLLALDRFLRMSASAAHPKNRLRVVLSKSQRGEILGLTFSDGFRKARFFNFSGGRVSELRQCWAHA